MPTSTLLQLIARGRHDVYLTGEPQTTFFRQVYRRYTPFAIESIPIELDGTLQFGQRLSCLIPRKAELLSQLFLEIDLPPVPDVSGGPSYLWANDIGHALIRDVSIEIGEKEIDKQTGEWMNLWAELTTPAGLRDGFNEMVGHYNDFPNEAFTSGQQKNGLRLQIPLRFWFCNNIGLALPLIALQAHPVRLVMHLRPFTELWWGNTGVLPCYPPEPVQPTRIQLFGDYIFLDKAERQLFAAREHEYLIEQVQVVPPQSVPAGVNAVSVPLMINHACKEFIWVVQQTRARELHEWFNYSNRMIGDSLTIGERELMASAILRLDGYDRFYRRGAHYFRLTQPYQRHTNIPGGVGTYIYVYSMSLRPEAEQPSGSLNASKIDDITWNLAFDMTPSAVNYERLVSFFVPNYNVLRIVGGLGGLAFIS